MSPWSAREWYRSGYRCDGVRSRGNPSYGIPHRVRMRVRYDFHDLFTMEMANNHSGSVEHGKRIIREIGEVVAQTKAANLSQYAATLCAEVKPRHTPGACRCVRR